MKLPLRVGNWRSLQRNKDESNVGTSANLQSGNQGFNIHVHHCYAMPGPGTRRSTRSSHKQADDVCDGGTSDVNVGVYSCTEGDGYESQSHSFKSQSMQKRSVEDTLCLPTSSHKPKHQHGQRSSSLPPADSHISGEF